MSSGGLKVTFDLAGGGGVGGGKYGFALLIEKDRGKGFSLNAGVQVQERCSHCMHRW